MSQYFENDINLKSKLRLLKYSYQENNFLFNSDLGVFAKNGVDMGSQLLAETYFRCGRKNVSVLDVGCGYGFLGITLAKVMNCNVEMIDVNQRAVHLAKMNLKENKVNANVFISNMYENITNKYDVIITNPPIRAGKQVYLNIINESFNYLNESGELWFVMRTNHGVKTVYKSLLEKYDTKILEKNYGFYVISAKSR